MGAHDALLVILAHIETETLWYNHFWYNIQEKRRQLAIFVSTPYLSCTLFIIHKHKYTISNCINSLILCHGWYTYKWEWFETNSNRKWEYFRHVCVYSYLLLFSAVVATWIVAERWRGSSLYVSSTRNVNGSWVLFLHREQTSILMQSTNFARFCETAGRCKNSDKHVMAEGNGKKEKRHVHWSVSSRKIKRDTKLTGGWQPCLSFTGRSTCVTLIWVPKVGTGGLTTRIACFTGIPSI